MDHRAVEALVVVLDHDLPVGRDLVDDLDADPQASIPNRSKTVRLSRRRPAIPGAGAARAEVHEQEPGVRLDREPVQGIGVAVEPLGLPRSASRSGSRSGRRSTVVGADERLPYVPGCGNVVHELRPPVRADVVEAVELALSVPRDQDRLPGEVANEVVARLGHLLRAPEADPVAEPDPLAFLLPDLGARVVRPAEVGQGFQLSSRCLIVSCSSIIGLRSWMPLRMKRPVLNSVSAAARTYPRGESFGT